MVHPVHTFGYWAPCLGCRLQLTLLLCSLQHIDIKLSISWVHKNHETLTAYGPHSLEAVENVQINVALNPLTSS